MTGRDLASVAFKVWGLVLVLGSVAAAPAALLLARANVGEPEQTAFVRAAQAASIIQPLSGLILGLCLVIWAEVLARWAVPEGGPVQIGVDAAQLLSVGLAIVGAVVLIDGLSTAASVGYVLSGKPRWVEQGSLSYLWERQPETIIRAGVNVIAGLLLAFGRKGAVAAWQQVRSYAERGRGLTRG